MDTKTKPPDSETVVPIGKDVISTFAKSPCIFYANHDNGSLYISNGQYIMKADPIQLDDLIEQANKRRRTESEKITPRERTEILKYVDGDKGKFELTGEPLDFEISDKLFISMFADDKQYFGYNKTYIDIFTNGENRLFVDDNATYDTLSHNMIAKSPGGEILGVVLPVRLTDEIYAELADVLPLKIKWKNELERIKDNPTNDPYIGKEFFDGTDTHIIAALKNIGDEDVYVVPIIENGKPSRGASYVNPDEMENQIMRWETKRIDREEETAAQEKQARNEAVKKAEYENTNGFADSLPPMQKANTLKALNDFFVTKDKGILSVKQFIANAIEDGKPLEARKVIKDKYRDMDAHSYTQSIARNTQSEAWARHKAVSDNRISPDNPDAVWLKDKHPYLHYCVFKDESVLPDSFFSKEYCVNLSDTEYYRISKTAYDYGNYLMDNPGAKAPQVTVTVEKESPPVQEETKPPPRPFTHIRQSPWGEVMASDKLCPGVYTVTAEKQGGIMVARDMTAALSPAALKCGVKYNDFLCFEDNGAKDVALRELIDKKLITIPGGAKEIAAAEEKINNSLRENNPGYWRSRENRRESKQPVKTAPAHDER